MGPVSWADDLTSFHFGLSQRLAVVCATVFYRINLGAAAYDNDGDAVDLGREGYRLVNGLNTTDVDPLRGHSEVYLVNRPAYRQQKPRFLLA
jgi:hypothetical protein